MISILLFASLIPVTFALLITWYSFAYKYKALSLIVLVIFYESLFFITTLGIDGKFLSDVALILMLSIITLNMHKLYKYINFRLTNYTGLVVIFLMIVCISLIFSSYMVYGQPIIIGIFPAREYLFILSLFYAISLKLNLKDITLFFKYLAYIGLVVSILTIIEITVFGGNVIFSEYYAIEQLRGNDIRIHVATFLVSYSIIYSFLHFKSTNNKYSKYIYSLIFFICLINLIFFIQTRAALLGVFLTLSIIYFRQYKSIKITSLIAIISIGLLAIIFTKNSLNINNSKIGSLAISVVEDLTTDDNNVSIRLDGANYFINFTNEHSYLFGLGIYSETNYPNNPITVPGDIFNYYLVDINGLSTYIHFGFLGTIYLIYLMFKTFRDAKSISKDKDVKARELATLFFYLLFYILVTPTLDNIIVLNKLFYTGLFFYFLGGYYKNHSEDKQYA